MSLKKISKDQPKSFEFTSKNLEIANKIIKNYPEGKHQSAVMALLYIAQKQNNNWIPLAAIKYIAEILGLLDTNGAFVSNINPSGPAKKAGINKNISPTALIDPSAQIGNNVSVGHYSIIEKNVIWTVLTNFRSHPSRISNIERQGIRFPASASDCVGNSFYFI